MTAVNLAGNLTRTVIAHEERPAVRLDDAVTTYGDLDEASARIAGLLSSHGVAPDDRVAIMLPNVQMRLVDGDGNEVPAGQDGEIVIRGHNVMKGYWRRPEGTAAAIPDGWFRTGDIGRVDEEGYFSVVDRKKDLIIRGGYNVYPREIEEVLYEHPAVAEAAVIGVLHPELGEEVGAAVAVKPGTTVTPDELRDYVKGQAAAYKYPRRVWFVDALPKGATGKILKREIVAPTEPEGG
jgi:long-chain acyl-CoA synthetase